MNDKIKTASAIAPKSSIIAEVAKKKGWPIKDVKMLSHNQIVLESMKMNRMDFEDVKDMLLDVPFTIVHVDPGFARVVYATRNRHGERILYCIQDNTVWLRGVVPGKGSFAIYRCGTDFEPQNKVRILKAPIDLFEVPLGTERTEREVRDWIIHQSMPK